MEGSLSRPGGTSSVFWGNGRAMTESVVETRDCRGGEEGDGGTTAEE